VHRSARYRGEERERPQKGREAREALLIIKSVVTRLSPERAEAAPLKSMII